MTALTMIIMSVLTLYVVQDYFNSGISRRANKA